MATPILNCRNGIGDLNQLARRDIGICHVLSRYHACRIDGARLSTPGRKPAQVLNLAAYGAELGSGLYWWRHIFKLKI